MMTPIQCRMARAALKWSIRDLGAHAGMSFTTVARFEDDADSRQSTVKKLADTLKGAGITFYPNGAVHYRPAGEAQGPDDSVAA